MENRSEVHRLDDADFRGAEAAMLRAAKAARDEARKAGLTIPVWENGAVVRKHPDELEEEARKAEERSLQRKESFVSRKNLQ